jgi:hypothetical protein
MAMLVLVDGRASMLPMSTIEPSMAWHARFDGVILSLPRPTSMHRWGDLNASRLCIDGSTSGHRPFGYGPSIRRSADIEAS